MVLRMYVSPVGVPRRGRAQRRAVACDRPLLLHQSDTGWTAATAFQDIVQTTEATRATFLPYIPCFQIRLCDLKQQRGTPRRWYRWASSSAVLPVACIAGQAAARCSPSLVSPGKQQGRAPRRLYRWASSRAALPVACTARPAHRTARQVAVPPVKSLYCPPCRCTARAATAPPALQSYRPPCRRTDQPVDCTSRLCRRRRQAGYRTAGGAV
jgi:hypothetical protein